MKYDKFRYEQEKKEKIKKQSQKAKELKQVRISIRIAEHDLQIKADLVKKFLTKGHPVEIMLYLKGREKINKEWANQKLNEFLTKIDIPYQVTLKTKETGLGLITQIIKK